MIKSKSVLEKYKDFIDIHNLYLFHVKTTERIGPTFLYNLTPISYHPMEVFRPTGTKKKVSEIFGLFKKFVKCKIDANFHSSLDLSDYKYLRKRGTKRPDCLVSFTCTLFSIPVLSALAVT